MLKLTYVTSNDGKFEAAQSVLPGLERLIVDAPEIQTMDMHELVRDKLCAVMASVPDANERILIVEDAGLVFDGMKDFPGTMLKWCLKGMGKDGLLKLYRAFGCQYAEPVIVIGVQVPGKPPAFFEGRDRGTMVEPHGSNGFGYAPYFLPDGSTKTYAEDWSEGYRVRGLRKVKEYLQNECQWHFPTV